MARGSRPGWFGESQRHSLASRGIKTVGKEERHLNVMPRPAPVKLEWKPEDKRTISVTYDVVTPESAVTGEVAEEGYEEENISITSVEDILSIFDEYGRAFELGDGLSYYQVDPERDYMTGSETKHAIHLKNFTDAELDRIVDALGVNGNIVDFSLPLRPRRVR